jgi:hypothetical protein
MEMALRMAEGGLRVMTNQVEHKVKVKMGMARKAA